MAKQAQQQMTAEETLARLSEQVKFTLTFTVEPQPDPKTKRKNQARKPRYARALEEFTARQAKGHITREALPSFRVTGTTTILGRKLEEIFENILPDNIEGTKHEIQNRFYWYIKNLYLSKTIATGNQAVECVVDLR